MTLTPAVTLPPDFQACRRRAFTLIEVLVVITIIAVVGAIVLPRLTADDQIRLTAASSIIASDIELAQVMTIAYPEQPVVVVFDPPKSTYHLSYADDPATPLLRPGTNQPIEVTLGEGRAASAAGVTFELIEIPGNTLAFNAQGGVEDLSTKPYVVLKINGREIGLKIATTTGTVSETTDIPKAVSPPKKGGKAVI